MPIKIVGLVERMRTDDDFAPVTSDLCAWCDYLSMCPEGQASTAR